eukprot:TRINITY_DN49_c0_g1_i6.p1 TRINITY_DN49_c0_g1~~TRINITY_DN49_c0_g1_i6.p1  ORF type:complete len:342 (+),score=102.33 TRINITY_DN49_c0_g1_i6:29-1027(+)
MKAVPFLVMCLSCASANLLAQPVFYAGENCTGDVDPASALWGYSTKNDVTVKPFSSKDWYSGYALYQCMTDSSITYSVMLKIDSTACPGNGANTLQLSYWNESTTCAAAATSVTTLTEGSCVATPLGSAFFNTSLNASELCVMTNLISAMKTGGLRLSNHQLSSNCTGFLPSTQLIDLNGQSCGAEPQCRGCCQNWDSKDCTPDGSPKYLDQLATCREVSGSWEGALMTLGFSDNKCTTKDTGNPILGIVLKLSDTAGCTSYSEGYVPYSIETNLVAPLTIDIYCQWVQLNTKYNVDGFLSWDEFNKRVNGAPAAHPVSVLALVVLLVTVLF